MIQWRKEPWDPLSLTLSLTGRYLYDRVLTCLRPEEKSQKKYLVQRKVRENQQRHVKCSLNSDLSNIQHVTEKGFSLLVIGDSKWNLHWEILGWAEDSEHHPEPQKRVPHSAESQSYSAAGARRDGAGKINMGAPRKYTSGKSGFILYLMCVRIHTWRDLWEVYQWFDLNSWWVWWQSND